MSSKTVTITSKEDWPVHQPAAYNIPIPGQHWYSGCEPGGDYDPERGTYAGTGPRVDPVTGICEGCGKVACRVCGREHCPDHFGDCEECGTSGVDTSMKGADGRSVCDDCRDAHS